MLAILLAGTVSAAPTTMEIDAFSVGTKTPALKDSYAITVDVPRGFQADEFFQEIDKGGFNIVSFKILSQAPAQLKVRDKVKPNPDPSAKQELHLVVQHDFGASFVIYRRLSSNPLLVLECSGEAETEANLQTLARTCRSAKLR